MTRHKDLLKKDILKKRAQLEKELQQEIHVSVDSSDMEDGPLCCMLFGVSKVVPSIIFLGTCKGRW